MLENNERFCIYGTEFSCLDLESGFQKIVNHDFSRKGYVCFPSTNLIAHAYKEEKLRNIYNNSFISFADGKYTEFYARWKGNKKLKNVSAYDLLNLLLRTDLTHFFYGSSDSQLLLIEKSIKKEFPNSKVLGYKAAPWVSIDKISQNPEILSDIQYINKLGPDLIWIGIGYPKQEYLMNDYIEHLNRGIMLGVGAVLSYRANTIKMGPRWVKNLGLRWLLRLIQEPRRLSKKMIPLLIEIIFLFIKHDILRIKLKLK